MSTKHTQGPWRLSQHKKDGYVNVDADRHGKLARVVWRMSNEAESPECQANARLIAAAPDLLAALEGLITDKAVAFLGESYFTAARAAIAKARE